MSTPQHITLAQASSLLGVSKATLRNWDRAGKLSAFRHPINSYRLFDLAELQKLQTQLGLPLDIGETSPDADEPLDQRGVRRLVQRLHAILRDTDSQSSIITRFDEMTKLLFAKVMADRAGDGPFAQGGPELPDAVRNYYAGLSVRYQNLVPARFASLDCSDRAIAECASALRLFDFSQARFDVKGLAYEEVIRHTFDKGDHQQFFTPPQVVDFIVSLCAPFLRGDVADPAAGTGGFLAATARRRLGYASLTSFEIDERLSWVSGINMLLHDAHDVRTVFLPDGGTLGLAADAYFSSFDTIVTNPPFGSDFTDREALDRLQLGAGRSTRRRGVLFLEQCHRLLRDGGTLALIIDEGVLSLSHAADARRFLLENFDLRAVVSLPETAFMPYATVNASVLLLTKRSSTDNGRRVFFARAETVGRKANGDDDVRYDRDGTNRLESDLPGILTAWAAFLETGEVSEDAANAYAADVAGNLARRENGHRIDYLYHHPSRLASEALIARCPYPLHRLGELCVERKATVVPSQDLADSTIRYTGLAHVESRTGLAEQVPTPAGALKSGVKAVEPGDILFAKMRPNLRKVALMDFAEPGYASPECAVLTVRRDRDGSPVMDPLLLSALLRSDLVFGQIMHLIGGIGRPRIGAGELLDVKIPVPPRPVQERLRAAYLDSQSEAARLRAEAEALLGRAQRQQAASVDALAESVATGGTR